MQTWRMSKLDSQPPRSAPHFTDGDAESRTSVRLALCHSFSARMLLGWVWPEEGSATLELVA